MKRIQTTLITGLLLLGVSSVHASPLTWFTSLQNNAIVASAIEKAKNNRIVIGTAVAAGAALATAYGIYATFFKDELAPFRKNAAAGTLQADVINAFDEDIANINKVHIPQLPKLFVPSDAAYAVTVDYNLACQTKNTKEMKRIAVGLLKTMQKLNVQ